MGGAIDLERRKIPNYDFVKVTQYIASCNFYPPSELTLPVGEELPIDARVIINGDARNPITIYRDGAPSLVVHVSSLLDCFWNSELDSPCLVCRQPFQELDPPVRTVSLEQICPTAIRIHNRHLGCLKSQRVPIVPMSHVWDGSIAAANVSGKSTPEALECVHRVLNDILPIVTGTFIDQFDAVEFWHDYLSIPQWQRPIQQALLVMLPEIYKSAPLCLIHLHDISSEKISNAVKTLQSPISSYRGARPAAYSAPYSRLSSGSYLRASRNTSSSLSYSNREVYNALVSFFHASWFQRMWVSLEYAYCRQACVYTANHVILWNGSRDNYDSFSLIFDAIQQKMGQWIEKFGMDEFSRAYDKMAMPLLGPLSDMRKNVHYLGRTLSFGEALAYVAGRNATCYRDRFIAISSFLKIDSYAKVLKEMPCEPEDACLWLASRCLERGDYSPLLMLQQEEEPHPKAPWLVGHQNMLWNMWDLGSPTAFKPGSVIIKDNVAQLQLHHVGTVERLWILKHDDTDGIATFDFVLGSILSHDSKMDVLPFLLTLDRIYGIPTFLRSYRSTGTQLYSHLQRFNSGVEGVKDFLHSLKLCDTGSEESLAISRRLASTLLFDQRLTGTAAFWTRLSYAGNPLHQADLYHDCLAAVRCYACGGSFVYRLSMLKHTDGFLHLYRIPRLHYASTLENGIGLLICDNRIVGRMIYGTPACPCTVEDLVEIS